MTSSSADRSPAADARSRALRLVAVSLVVAGALLGVRATSPGATSAVFTDTETTVTTVRTAVDFDAPRSVPAPTPSATPAPTPTPTGLAAPSREAPRAPREDRSR